MKTHRILARMTALFLALIVAALLPRPALAHCDSMDGPVVKDAQRALATIRKALEMTLAVRGESEAAKNVADRYFFETLVRIHRASEGEGFTGIKPAGTVEPAIAAADRALADGNIDPLADKIRSGGAEWDKATSTVS